MVLSLEVNDNNGCLIKIKKILSFDLEWDLEEDQYGEHRILAVAFADSSGYSESILLEDFMNMQYQTSVESAEYELLRYICDKICQYNWSIGFYSTLVKKYDGTGIDSDLITLHRRCIRYGLDSIIRINYAGFPYIVGNGNNYYHNHIDVSKIFNAKNIQAAVYKNVISGDRVSLDTLSIALFGDAGDIGGKYKGISGAMYDMITDVEDKRRYVLQDAVLALRCVQKNDYEIFRIINAISKLTQISFVELCRSVSATKICASVMDKAIVDDFTEYMAKNGNVLSNDAKAHYKRLWYYLNRNPNDHYDHYYDQNDSDLGSESGFDGNNNSDVDDDYFYDDHDYFYDDHDYDGNYTITETKSVKSKRYSGAIVIESDLQRRKNVTVFDGNSMYPTQMKENNISPETVDCTCCVNNPLAKIAIPYGYGKDDLENQLYLDAGYMPPTHICIKFRGVFAKIVEEFMGKRDEHKRNAIRFESREDELISSAYKVIINSLYGQLGSKFSKFENVQAAELVTRFARYTFLHIRELAEACSGWDVFYGDTDSLFTDSKITEVNKNIFMDQCALQLNIRVDFDRFFEDLLMFGSKNYVFTVLDSKTRKKKLFIKGNLIKKNRCLWARNAAKQFLEDVLINREIETDPLANLKAQVNKLEIGQIETPEINLLILANVGSNPENYKVNVIGKRIGLVKNLKRGDTARYYLGDSDKGGFTFDVKDISIYEYKRQLKDLLKKVFLLLDYNVNDINNEIFGGVISLKERVKTKGIKINSRRNKYRQKLFTI